VSEIRRTTANDTAEDPAEIADPQPPWSRRAQTLHYRRGKSYIGLNRSPGRRVDVRGGIAEKPGDCPGVSRMAHVT